jgi:hypothetical protein
VYGSEDKENVAWVKALWDELKLAEAYEQQEETSYTRIVGMISKSNETLPDLFTPILDKIHKRQK